MSRTLRAAAAQFAVGSDVTENLATARRMIRTAADQGAELIVLPEFCNHLSIYRDAEHAWEVAITTDGEWVEEMAAVARERGVWVQFNATVRRSPATASAPRPWITNTNFVLDDHGVVVSVTDKTVLMGAEGEFLTPADHPSAPIDSPFGLLGSYACMDGIVPEVPRAIAARGARVLLNSLNSFALDEASVHIPVRAAENRSWVIACCKVGPLLPPDKVELFSQMMGVPADMLSGAGESQIVAPDGTVVAKGPREGEAVVIADIDLDRCGEARPDGTDPWAARRPELYGALARATPVLDDHPRSATLLAATATEPTAVAGLAAEGVQLVVLPELSVTPMQLDTIASSLAGTDTVVVTSLRDGDRHVGVAIDHTGVIHEQVQLHGVARHDWSRRLGDTAGHVDLPWGRLAIMVGDDLIHPEVARLAALSSVDVLAVPFDAQERWDAQLGVVERAAENRMCVVASTRSNDVGRSLIADLPPDFTLWAQSRERPFDGTINQPDLFTDTDTDTDPSGRPSIVRATIHPARAVQRQISKGTNLVDGRPWQICSALVH